MPTVQINARNGRPLLVGWPVPPKQRDRVAAVLATMRFALESPGAGSEQFVIGDWEPVLRQVADWRSWEDFAGAVRYVRKKLYKAGIAKEMPPGSRLRTPLELLPNIKLVFGTPDSEQSVRVALEWIRKLVVAHAGDMPPAISDHVESPIVDQHAFEKRSASAVWLDALPHEHQTAFALITAEHRDSIVLEPILVDVLAGERPPLSIAIDDERFVVPAVLDGPLADLRVEAATNPRLTDDPKLWARTLKVKHSPDGNEIVLKCGLTSYFPRLLYNRAFEGNKELGIDPVADLLAWHRDQAHPIEDLYQSIPATLGMVIAVTTSDDHAILTRRSRTVGSEMGRWQAAAGELAEPSCDVVEGQFDIRRAAFRALREEVCPDPESQVTALLLTGLAIELSLYQVQLVFAASVNYPAARAFEIRERCKDRRLEVESTEVVALDDLDSAIAERLGNWQPTAVPSLRALRSVASRLAIARTPA